MSLAMTDDRRDVAAVMAGRQPADTGDATAQNAAHFAFARIYDRHAPVVRALCRRHLPSEADADDALQETFIRAFHRLDQVTDPDHLRTWLYAIARLVCAERRRAAARRHRHEHDAALEAGAVNSLHANNHAAAHPHRHTASEPAERAETLARLNDALDELPDDERLAIHLYYLETDPVAAATDALGLSRSAFYKLLARARGHLGSMLGQVSP